MPTQTGLSTANGRSGGGPFTLELGVKFTLDAPAQLSAVAFYKDGAETGTHVGRLWTADGILLAGVPFAAETASGRQEQALPTPIALAAGVTYVASVGVNNAFVQTLGGLNTPIGSGPLHSVLGENAVFADAAESFPTQSFLSSNYFVDVVVLDDGTPAAPTLESVDPANHATGVPNESAISAFVTRDLDPTTVAPSTVSLERADGTPVPVAVAYDAGARKITLTPTVPLETAAAYAARISTGVHSADGTPFAAPVVWRFSTQNVPPTVLTRVPAPGSTGVPVGTTVSATFSRDLNAATITGSRFTLVNGAGVPATVSYDAATRTATLTPTAPLVGGKTYTARLAASIEAADGITLGDDVTWSFTAACPCMLLPPGLAPVATGLSTANGRPGGPWSLEFGVKFNVDTPGRLTALSFYKDAAETGSHVGSLWTADGILLASVVFTGETASGRQEQPLATPIGLAPGTTYVASVGINASFVQTVNGLSAPTDSGILHAVADGANGVFADAAGTFPTQTFSSSNYFVDVEVLDDGTPAAPTLSAAAPANGATGVFVDATVSATASRALDPATVTGSTVTLRRSNGTLVPAAVAYDAAAKSIVLTPTSPLDELTTFTAQISTDVRGAAGTPLAGAVSWTFRTGLGPPTVIAQSPSAGAAGVSTTTLVSMTFSRDMDAASITAATLTLTEAGGPAVPAAVSYDAPTRTATLTPGATLLASTGYTVRSAGSVRASDGAPFGQPVLSTFTTALGAAVRINVGDGNYTTNGGLLFKADVSFTGGTLYTSGNKISGTDDMALYQSERHGNFSYSVPVTSGTYDVRLYFAELYFGRTAPGCEGMRVFSMDIADTPASPDISNLDICSEVGPEYALRKLVRNVVVRDGVLDLSSIAGAADEPELGAIEVLPAGTPLGDITPPSATTLTAAGSLAQAALSWPAATDDVGVTTYDVFRGTTPGFAPTFSTRIAQTTQLTYVDMEIPAAGTYYYIVRAEDDAGNRGAPSNVASALVTVDTTPPTAPGSLVATGGIGQATVTWNASTDDFGPIKYDVFRSTTSGFTPATANRIARVTTTSYTDKPLPGGTYYYVVKAFDSANNTSPASNQATASVTADTTAPSITLTAPAASSTISGVVTLTATASDNVTTKGVQFMVDGDPVGLEDTSAPFSALLDTTTLGDGLHTFDAVARDSAGNLGMSQIVSASVSNAPAPAPGTGLVAAWGFGDPIGTTVADSSGNGNTGTLENALLGAGHDNGGLSLNGTNARVNVASSTLLGLPTGFTLEAWVNPSALGNVFRTVLLKERGKNLAYALYAATDNGRPSVHYWNGAEVLLKGPAPLQLNTWTHLAGVYNGSALRLYVNGALVATKNAGGSVTASTNPLRLGGNSVWGEWFAGALDDVRVYNRGLTGGEILADMSAPVG
ncbi:MAG TPA: Ig-like domain-containing protein [Gaiellaceae bacterium]